MLPGIIQERRFLVLRFSFLSEGTNHGEKILQVCADVSGFALRIGGLRSDLRR
jgi:hypothetical protein